MEFIDRKTRIELINAIPSADLNAEFAEWAKLWFKKELEADRPQGWIPCSERLPEEEGEYLVTAKKYAFDSSYYDVQIAYCSPNKKWFHISNCEIVAWMPRPKPWKGADDE